MLIIAERINSSRKSIAQAIEARDGEFIKNEARLQVGARADYLEVNDGQMLGREVDCLSWLIDTAKEATSLPLSVDSPDADDQLHPFGP